MQDLSENNKTNNKETPKMIKVRDDEGLNWDRADEKETDIKAAKEWELWGVKAREKARITARLPSQVTG